MIKNNQIDRFTGLAELAGGEAIGGTWLRVAARVVVGNNDAGASEAKCVSHDVADRKADICCSSGVLLDMQAVGGAVDVCDEQFLSRLPVEAGSEKAARSLMTVEERW